VTPGGYRIERLSSYARALLEHLGIAKSPGESLTESEVEAILDFHLTLLEASIAGTVEADADRVTQLHVQVPFRRPTGCSDPVVTFSGGVGELIYAHALGAAWPPRTHFGDLGVDLAQRIVRSGALARHLHAYRPESAGRATVYGLLRHSTEVSGSTLFLPRPEVLPLADVPILGSLNVASTDVQIRDAIDLVRRSSRGGCLRVGLGSHEAAAVRDLGGRLARELREAAFPADRPLVILVSENVGKVLGHYITQWGALPLSLVVIDELALRDAQYVRIGSARSQVVPVSFYGLNEHGDSP
jgi:ethanolamine utilization protein EutA